MKKIYGFAFASAIMMLASCSNDNEPAVTPNPTPAPDGPGSYVAINICNPAGTRADEYEIGTTDENNVKSGTFYIIDKTNKVAFVQELDITAPWQGPADLGNTVEKIGGATMLIPDALWSSDDFEDNKDVTAGQVPTGLSVLVVLNDVASVQNGNNTYRKNVTFPVGTELSEILAAVTPATEAAGQFDEAEKNNFLMTNSTYIQSTSTSTEGVTSTVNNVIQAEPILTKYLVNNKNEAVNNPLNIFVERSVARLDYSKNVPAGQEWLSNNKIHLENVADEMTITPSIVGVYVHNDPENSALFKALDTTNLPSGWDVTEIYNEANHRSYWATMLSGIVQNTYKYQDVIDGNIGAGFSETATTKQYIHENTSEDQSTILVVAKLDFEDAAGDLASIYGQFTTETGAINIVANTLRSLGYRIRTTNKDTDSKVTSTEIETINPVVGEGDDAVKQLDWSGNIYDPSVNNKVESTGNRTYLKINFTPVNETTKVVELVKINGTAYTPVSVEELNAELAKIPISLWKDGYCYYYVDIEHANSNAEKTTAVVRNHLYNVVFQGISGLGTPIFDPSKDIDPVPPMYDEGENVYLKAAINVLQWRVASQNVVLGGKK
ncbi:MAG: fimbria major subunit [Muribaculaceae bacterium]|nr:fimbria major subunit [Muribaculaceae bacterium]